jgi:uncharacterized membrane protein
MEGTLRIILGLPFILFIPGYLFVFALFPQKKTDQGIDVIERIALSLGLSLAIVPLIGLGLNYTVWGIRLEPILFSLFFFNIIFAAIGIYRWFHLTKETRFIIHFIIATPQNQSKLDQALTIILAISIIITVSILIYIIITPRTGEQFTEFYILGPTGLADDYPKNLTIGENADIIIGIVNHEYQTMNYTVEVWLINQSYSYDSISQQNETQYHHLWYLDTIHTSLDHVPVDIETNWTAQWEYNYTISLDHPGSQKLTFLLFTQPSTNTYMKGLDYADQAEPIIESAYRSLHLWINVME